MLDLGFTTPVPRNGYRWWYLDALSDDGRHGITVIAFLGSVFSPWYARARRGGGADPLDHCAFNIALYGPGRRWALAERGSAATERSPSRLRIGPSSLQWDGNRLIIDVAEIGVPLPRRICGRITVEAAAAASRTFALDGAGHHRWHPIAPAARVTVDLVSPRLRWSGPGYLDSNAGDGPLEDAFRGWDWCRAMLPDGAAALLYDTVERDGARRSVALRVAADGATSAFDPPLLAALPATRWRVGRRARSESPRGAVVVDTLEDTPFYSRSVLATRLVGVDAIAVHESLSLERFTAPWVQTLLPFRIRRHAA